MTGRYQAMLQWSVAGLCLLCMGAAAAGQLKGSADLGYAASSGNSRTSNLDTKLALEYRSGPWRHSLKLGAVSASTDGSSTAERYALNGKTEYDYSKHNYSFGQVDYLKDLFAGTRQSLALTGGYGRRIIDDPAQSLDAEIGAGVRRTQAQKPSLVWNSDGIVQLSGHYRRRISATSSFEQTLRIQSGHTNTFTEAVTSLKVMIVGNLAMRLSYTVDHNSVVPDGLAKTDTYTAVALSYQFGAEH